MKTNSPSSSIPRIVNVAHRIAQIQARRDSITKRQDVLELESIKLEEEKTLITTEQLELQRELDKLSSGAGLKP